MENAAGWMFQQDYNPKHTSNRAKVWSQNNDIGVLGWDNTLQIKKCWVGERSMEKYFIRNISEACCLYSIGVEVNKLELKRII